MATDRARNPTPVSLEMLLRILGLNFRVVFTAASTASSAASLTFSAASPAVSATIGAAALAARPAFLAACWLCLAARAASSRASCLSLSAMLLSYGWGWLRGVSWGLDGGGDDVGFGGRLLHLRFFVGLLGHVLERVAQLHDELLGLFGIAQIPDEYLELFGVLLALHVAQGISDAKRDAYNDKAFEHIRSLVY